MSNDKVIETLQENVLIIKFNRPKKKNALDIESFVQITKALDNAASDDNIKIVVFNGAEDFYSSGFDLSSERGNRLYVALEGFVKAFITFPKLLVAIVNGPAIGIAATTLALCDLVYASENAYFYTPFTKVGAAAEGCSSVTFPRLLGEKKAMEMLILNYIMPAKEALEYGFINKVYKSEELHKKSWETIREILNLNQTSVLYSKKAAAYRVFALKLSNGSKKRRIPGWNERVKQAYATSKEAFINWVAAGRPSTGVVAEKRSSTKKDFKKEYKKCLRDSEEIKASRIALSLHNKNFNSFWRQTNKAMKTKNKTLAVEVNGKSDEREIAKEFASHFGFTTSHPADKTPMSRRIISISAAEVDKIIQCENRNKAAGHDGLVAEHLIYSGPYLPTLG
ncbi:unnamed protein product [Danaus chrysippus]|uniref:(African queen) hypothetical protein n=1 Tax=Danaus chrysippus TaxID=151541 RepID=A0A8J2VQC1_9NEOP|nr:unnamed protein product [Danaus chrysippus]